MIIKILSIILISMMFASDQIPSAIQDHPILIENGTVYTVSNGIKKDTDILFDEGKIIAIGSNLSVTNNNIERIDAKVNLFFRVLFHRVLF